MSDQPVVRLRPLLPEDAAVLDSRETSPYNWSGFVDPGGLAAQIAARQTLREDGGNLAVVDAEGVLLGTVSWHRVRTGASSYSWCWNMGIELLPNQRGKGYGAPAQRSLAAYLFAQTPAQRIEATTETENIAEQRSLEKAGFTREGVLRQAEWRDGSWHDMVSYSILRGDVA